MFSKHGRMGKMKNICAPIFVTDFEGSRKIGVVEYGVAVVEGGRISGALTRICAPKTPIPQRDAKFFGIDNAQANAMPPFSESVGEFVKMRKRGFFASHNASVEDSLLRDAMPSPGFAPDMSGGRTASWGPWLDTCMLAKNIYRGLKNAKLSELVAAFGLQDALDAEAQKHCPEARRKWHCALYDALASALILMHICSQEGFEEVTLEWLAKYSGNGDIGQNSFL